MTGEQRAEVVRAFIRALGYDPAEIFEVDISIGHVAVRGYKRENGKIVVGPDSREPARYVDVLPTVLGKPDTTETYRGEHL